MLTHEPARWLRLSVVWLRVVAVMVLVTCARSAVVTCLASAHAPSTLAGGIGSEGATETPTNFDRNLPPVASLVSATPLLLRWTEPCLERVALGAEPPLELPVTPELFRRPVQPAHLAEYLKTLHLDPGAE